MTKKQILAQQNAPGTTSHHRVNAHELPEPNSGARLVKAACMGTAAFLDGVPSTPCRDRFLLAMMAGREVGGDTVPLMRAWSESWRAAAA